MKKPFSLFILSLFLFATHILASSSVLAVDLQDIENQVRQQAAERQRVATMSPEVLEIKPASVQPASSANNKPSKKYQDVEVIHWSLFGGAIRLRTLNEQLLLSIFSR